MRNLKTLTLLTTTAALAIGLCGSASAKLIGDSVETSSTPDIVVDDAAVVEDAVKDADATVDLDGPVSDEVASEGKVLDEEVVLGGRDLDGEISPIERSSDDLGNTDGVIYTMTGGGAGDFDSGAAEQAADLAAEQAADRALDRIDAAPPALASLSPTKKN